MESIEEIIKQSLSVGVNKNNIKNTNICASGNNIKSQAIVFSGFTYLSTLSNAAATLTPKSELWCLCGAGNHCTFFYFFFKRGVCHMKVGILGC